MVDTSVQDTTISDVRVLAFPHALAQNNPRLPQFLAEAPVMIAGIVISCLLTKIQTSASDAALLQASTNRGNGSGM